MVDALGFSYDEITNCSLQYCTSVDHSFDGFSIVKLHLFVACCFSLFVKEQNLLALSKLLYCLFSFGPRISVALLIHPPTLLIKHFRAT
jgi:hypothetical protein